MRGNRERKIIHLLITGQDETRKKENMPSAGIVNVQFELVLIFSGDRVNHSTFRCNKHLNSLDLLQ